ncbi:aminoglycoside adenylyltransferase family protein [Pseudomonas subflava]|uniref:aminoglycoside adenylyltransferase family protein n=1 Tax=Pseudomonas subflava TaxID=2952933 RepID=UPI00207A6AB6|nr:aminoglycoside adenylyltransferase family protein [Pseudomonas subflava]
MTPPVPSSIAAQVELTLALLRQHLVDALLAVHLFGSAVDGGLCPDSDVDLLVTVAAPLGEPVRQRLFRDLLSVSAWPATADLRPLEVTLVVRDDLRPWRYPPRRELQFGEWLRAEIQAGAMPPSMTDPDLAILLTQARQRSACLLGPAAMVLLDAVPPADLRRALHDTVAQWREPADWQGDERNVVLAIGRIWFTLTTGSIVAKDVAAAWLLERLPDRHRPLLAAARAAYLGAADRAFEYDPAAVAAFIEHARREIEGLGNAPRHTDDIRA